MRLNVKTSAVLNLRSLSFGDKAKSGDARKVLKKGGPPNLDLEDKPRPVVITNLTSGSLSVFPSPYFSPSINSSRALTSGLNHFE